MIYITDAIALDERDIDVDCSLTFMRKLSMCSSPGKTRLTPQRARCVALALVVIVALASRAAAATYTVTNNLDSGPGSLRQAILALNANGGTANTITITPGLGTITLASELPIIYTDVTIDGSGATLAGANQYRGLFIYSGTVTLVDLTIQNVTAQGGNGGGLGQGGGGGGAGLGGAIFVASGANVTLSNVNLVNGRALGGNGGPAGSPFSGMGGGGGGLGGDGGMNGGGGGLGRGATGAGLSSTAQSGIAIGLAPGGSNPELPGGANGGGGAPKFFSGPYYAAGGGGISGGSTTNGAGGVGGFGGGGGSGIEYEDIGGAGGFGGGGAGSFLGGTGGFGGGGGGAWGGVVVGGTGGFGGGNGGSMGSAGLGGGGGLAAGGAIFVQDGGTLTIAGALTVNGSEGTAGTGGANCCETTTASGNGSAFGSGIFIAGNNAITFAPTSPQAQTISDAIADQTGSGGTGGNAGAGSLIKNGTGNLVLAGTNTYTGPTLVNAGVLTVSGAIGSSAVTVASDALLFGDGSIAGPVTVNGEFQPGIDTRAQIATGPLTVGATGRLTAELYGTTAGTTYDQVVVTGTVTLAGALAVPLGFVPTPGQVFTIIDNDDTDAVIGTFVGAAEGAILPIASRKMRISYTGGTGNDVTLTDVIVPMFTTIAGTSVMFGGAVSDVRILSGGNAPTGNVMFRLYGPSDPTCSGAPVFTDVKTVSGNGLYESSSFTPAAVGVYRWIADYSGDATNARVSSVCNRTATITMADQTITFGALGGRTFGDAPFGVSATGGGSGNLVTFLSTPSSVCTVLDTTVMIVGAGPCTITASQAGSTNYNAAPPVTQSFTVAPANQAITFGPLGGRTFGDAPFGVSATGGGSGNPVTFSSLTMGVCTMAGSTVSLIALGTCTIAAIQEGNANYNAAPQVQQSFTVAANCSAPSLPGSLPAGQVALPYNQTLTLTNGAAPVTMTLTGALPSGLTFTNGQFSGTPTVHGAFPITVTATDANSCEVSASYPLAIAAERRLLIGAASDVSTVRTFNVGSAIVQSELSAFGAFAGGVSVAQSDVDGNGIADIVVGAGPGAGPTVGLFDGASRAGRLLFFAFDPAYRGGVSVAAGDVTGDGVPEMIAAAGCAGTPQVRAFDGRTGALVRAYTIPLPVPTCRLNVAAGDLTGDGIADVIVGAGDLGASFVEVVDGVTGSLLRELYPFGTAFTGGVSVATGDVNGDGFADIVTGAGPGGTPHVRVFDGTTGSQIAGPLGSFHAYVPLFGGGVRVGAGDLNGDGRAEVITVPGPGGGPHVRVWDGASAIEIYGLYGFDPSFGGGLFVAGPTPSARMNIDIAARTIGTEIRIAGWALREIANDTTGTDAIHVWGYPIAGGAPVFVGEAPTRVARSDIAAAFGGEFLMSGFDFSGTLAAGTYDLVVYVRNSRTMNFDQVRVVRVTVP